MERNILVWLSYVNKSIDKDKKKETKMYLKFIVEELEENLERELKSSEDRIKDVKSELEMLKVLIKEMEVNEL